MLSLAMADHKCDKPRWGSEHERAVTAGTGKVAMWQGTSASSFKSQIRCTHRMFFFFFSFDLYLPHLSATIDRSALSKSVKLLRSLVPDSTQFALANTNAHCTRRGMALVDAVRVPTPDSQMLEHFFRRNSFCKWT